MVAKRPVRFMAKLLSIVSFLENVKKSVAETA
jgi:hypothetical protein